MAPKNAFNQMSFTKSQASVLRPTIPKSKVRGTPVTTARQALLPTPSESPIPPNVTEITIENPTENGQDTNATPTKLLLIHEVTIEHAEPSLGKTVVHEELLCFYSQRLSLLFNQAKSMRKKYKMADMMRKDLKRFVFPNTTNSEIEGSVVLQKEVVNAISQVYHNYPLTDSGVMFAKMIDKVIDEQPAKKRKADWNSANLKSRLEVLPAKGLIAVLERTFQTLHKHKAEEAVAAKVIPMKAAIQRRIILPNVEQKVVQCLVDWLYFQKALECEDAQQLYELQALAAGLGINQLSELCLSKLVNDTHELIESALRQGISLRMLLGFESDEVVAQGIPIEFASGNIAEIVFHRVVKGAGNIPERLRSLVIDTLAAHLDNLLWTQIGPMIGHKVALNIIGAMIHQREVKQKQADVKMETEIDTEDHLLSDTYG